MRTSIKVIALPLSNPQSSFSQCHRVFKRTCEVHDDCPCSEQPLICEDRECVKAKKVSQGEGVVE